MAITTDAPKDAAVIDLGAARKARAEERAKQGVPETYIKLDAGYVPVKAEFTLALVENLKDGDIRAAILDLLADPADVDTLLASGLSAQDVNVIVSHIGNSLGEASASPKS